MLRFLFSPGWLARLAAALALAAVMSLLGAWQLSRYQERAAINARIDAAASLDRAVPLATVLTPPAPGAELGPPAPAGAVWSVVQVTGRYDATNELLVRGRTVDGRVGFEVVTPLVSPDGTAVLVDRGWVPPAGTGLADRPEVPAPPAGEVTVLGRIRGSERGGPAPARDGGRWQARRIDTTALAPQLPHPLYHGYLLLDSQQPPVDPGLTPVPVTRENAWLNAGYAGQWWIFAGLVLVGYGWLVRRERNRRRQPHDNQEPGGSAGPAGGNGAPALPCPS